MIYLIICLIVFPFLAMIVLKLRPGIFRTIAATVTLIIGLCGLYSVFMTVIALIQPKGIFEQVYLVISFIFYSLFFYRFYSSRFPPFPDDPNK